MLLFVLQQLFAEAVVVLTQIANLSRGGLIEGSVQALKSYGVFIEVGGMSGLLYILQILYDQIEDLDGGEM